VILLSEAGVKKFVSMPVSAQPSPSAIDHGICK
jgi:hypothetical protein